MKKGIITICLALVLALTIVMLKNCFSYRIPNDAMGIQAVISRGQVGQLFLGSSAYRKGIDIQLVEEKMPKNSFVLTYNGNQPFNMAIELREMVEAGTKIDLVIADFNPSMMSGEADLSDKRLLWDIDFQAKMDLWNEIKRKESANLFTFYDYWVLSNNEYMATYPIAYPLIAGRYYLGGAIDEDAGTTEAELNQLEIKEADGLNELQLQSILEMIEICNDNNIRLLFVEAPRYTRMEKDENYQKKVVMLSKVLEDADTEYVLGSDLGFDNTNADYYTDLTHMSSAGRREFTTLLLQYLE